MKTPFNIPKIEFDITHENQISTGETITQTYEQIVLKGPHEIQFNIKSQPELIKVVYNLDYSQQCGTTTQPASGEIRYEPEFTTSSNSLLTNPADSVITGRFFPDKYQYETTVFPGLTTIDKDLNKVVHQVSVRVAQPSVHDYVNDLDIVDVRTFTNLSGKRGKALLLLEDQTNNFIVPMTLFGERQYTSTIELGDALFGQIVFNICVSRAPYDNVKPDGTEVVTTSESFPAETVFYGQTKFGTYEAEGFPGAVRDQFTINNTGSYPLRVLSVTNPSTPFYMDGIQLEGVYSPVDSGCLNSKSIYVYFSPPDLIDSAQSQGQNFSVTYQDSIIIENDSVNNPEIKIELTGTAKSGYLVVDGAGFASDDPVEFDPTLVGEKTVPVSYTHLTLPTKRIV